MFMHCIRLNDVQTNNQSFSHQQSVNPSFQPRHKKKSSIYQKPSRTPNYHRVKTDQRQSPSVYRNQQLNSYAASIPLVHATNSASKLHKAGQKVGGPKKSKKGKQIISVINLGKNLEESKAKASTTVTKRKQSADFSQKIKEKLQDFKIISSCLEEYVKQERRNHSEANLIEIVKIIGAFNRSEIAPISKPLEKLIGEIIASIRFSLPQLQLKSILKKSISFESPKRHPEFDQDDSGTVKKGPGSRQYLREKESTVGDVKKLQENLAKLQYQSNRLKNFLEEVSRNNMNEGNRSQKHIISLKQQQHKLKELMQLKQIAQQQQRIIMELEDGSQQQNTYRSDTSN